MSIVKQRYMREAQAKHRGTKTSYRTQIENLQILLAWEAAELTEGQAARALNVCRIEARELREKAILAGEEVAGEIIARFRHLAAKKISGANVERNPELHVAIRAAAISSPTAEKSRP